MRRVAAAYLALGLLLAPVPLLNVLQAESAAVVALAAYFISGAAAVRAFGARSASVGRVLARQEAALLVPLGVLLLAQFWAPNCTLGQGLLFYALFPGVTVVFAVALAYLLRGVPSLVHPGWVLGGLGLLLVGGGPLYDLGLHPQFYTYNHVFGGVLGPIYDEQLAVRPGLFAFRGLTLLWALLALLVGHRLRGRGPRWAVPACALLLGMGYVFSVPLGINTTAASIQERLGGHTRTAHFDLYYDSTQVDAPAAADLAAAHEAHYDWVRRRLERGPDAKGARIQSYLYPNPDVKGRLTGARTTSVSPVWLDTPQVHLLRDRVSQSLGHELAHVVSRPYGLPGLRASWAPGLVEGWAVALEPPSPGPSPDDLVRTAAQSDTTTTLAAEAQAVAQRLSPWGFWSGRGAVSYATMGSFVQYLLDQYGPARLKRVYAWGNFDTVYGRPLDTLAAEWEAHLRRAPVVARDAHGVVARRFARPSLFETECPHYVPPARQHYQTAQRAGRRRDTTRRERLLKEALGARPGYAAAHEALARHRLAQGRASAVWRQVDTLSTTAQTAALQVAQADAAVLRGAPDTARALYARARAQVPSHAYDLRARLTLRDATADRPAVVRVLTSGDSAAAQARRLAKRIPQDPRIRAWQAVRWMDARQYRRALTLWERLEVPVPATRPRGWRREWELQHAAWGATSALRGNAGNAARRWAAQAARKARVLGDSERTLLFEWWKRRAMDMDAGPRAGRLGRPSPNHASRPLVQAHGRSLDPSRRRDDPTSIPHGPCDS
ncbi:hypothetical protein [Salinibacter altiplanensis]|uniref:hypothetical protein n=1 Tax=Salinibacter altiplanensis TaxID=1803181 RepID=UPI000C9F37C3|nr:hypothetical protein [Salinibacter altiplanensis]